ncbi:astacin-like metalloprotease toxin 4 [Centruroides sculpturatus]|uniref:astacin-like metalloprotease toxin 4 n=1 Tax=Centruroides sculpturatus TaxID=218467 RepID=UPI000C6D5CD9|nr:astacin-like metalloprotease toxin 4 [Centruroides sculpturatus]
MARVNAVPGTIRTEPYRKKDLLEEDGGVYRLQCTCGVPCYSNVGRTGRAQPLSLGYGCYFPGTMAHELGHAIGFYHEHNRSDRDDYLNIFWINIMQNMKPQFKKLFPTENVLYDEFNYRSIMLYGETAFSKNPIKFKTMVAKKEDVTLRDVHDKQGPDESDYYRINKICFIPTNKYKYT